MMGSHFSEENDQNIFLRVNKIVKNAEQYATFTKSVDVARPQLRDGKARK